MPSAPTRATPPGPKPPESGRSLDAKAGSRRETSKPVVGGAPKSTPAKGELRTGAAGPPPTPPPIPPPVRKPEPARADEPPPLLDPADVVEIKQSDWRRLAVGGIVGVVVLCIALRFGVSFVSGLFAGGTEAPTPSAVALALATKTPTVAATLAVTETPRPHPTDRPTDIPTLAPMPTATAESVREPAPTTTPSSTEIPPSVASSVDGPEIAETYVDIGAPDDIERYALQGFGDAGASDGVAGYSCTLGGSDDHTWRLQDFQSPFSSVRVPVLPSTPVTVTLCISRMAPEDTWNLSLGGDALGLTGCTQIIESQPAEDGAVGPVMEVTDPIIIDAACVPSGELVLAFTDRTSFGAALWGILIQQTGATAPAQELELPTIAPVAWHGVTGAH